MSRHYQLGPPLAAAKNAKSEKRKRKKRTKTYVDLIFSVSDAQILKDGPFGHGVQVDHVLYALRLISCVEALHFVFSWPFW